MKMFSDPELWARLHAERVAEARAGAFRREAEWDGTGETFWFQVGGWVIRFGHWIQAWSAR
ncbi:MAG TPA: hypothetical protein VNK89_05650 [Thermoflexus sp.]|nr:hypothetical protein [Thermoflexus sp.]